MPGTSLKVYDSQVAHTYLSIYFSGDLSANNKWPVPLLAADHVQFHHVKDISRDKPLLQQICLSIPKTLKYYRLNSLKLSAFNPVVNIYFLKMSEKTCHILLPHDTDPWVFELWGNNLDWHRNPETAAQSQPCFAQVL